MRKPQNIFGYGLILNVTGALISFGIGMQHEAGGGSLGYVLVGFAITGLVTLLMALIPTIIYFKQIFKYKIQNGIAVFLFILCVWEISFIRLLAPVENFIGKIW